LEVSLIEESLAETAALDLMLFKEGLEMAGFAALALTEAERTRSKHLSMTAQSSRGFVR